MIHDSPVVCQGVGKSHVLLAFCRGTAPDQPDTFAVKAIDDIVVNGWIVIAKGAAGQGEVLSVGALFLGLPGLFAHNMVHGRDLEIAARTRWMRLFPIRFT
ncbi:MAG: hypothetical protein NVSMB31_00180 [Vulcanimicrobiaceae bacterium]